MARKLPKSSSLKRAAPSKDVLLTIYIICEGGTERDYFLKFAAAKKNSIVSVEASDNGGQIRTLIDKVSAKVEELTRKAKKSKDSFDKHFIVWGVSDVDNHPRLKEAVNLAAANNLNLSVSNPCFEVWGIFHYKQHNQPMDRQTTQSELKRLMPTYCHHKNPYFDPAVIVKDFEVAIKNAKYANQSRVDEGDEGGSPSSTVYELVELIMNGKK